MLRLCVAPAYKNGLATMALTENEHEKVQLCEKQHGKNNCGD